MCGTHTVETVRWLAPPPMLISYRSATSRNPSLCSCDRPPPRTTPVPNSSPTLRLDVVIRGLETYTSGTGAGSVTG